MTLRSQYSTPKATRERFEPVSRAVGRPVRGEPRRRAGIRVGCSASFRWSGGDGDSPCESLGPVQLGYPAPDEPFGHVQVAIGVHGQPVRAVELARLQEAGGRASHSRRSRPNTRRQSPKERARETTLLPLPAVRTPLTCSSACADSIRGP